MDIDKAKMVQLDFVAPTETKYLGLATSTKKTKLVGEAVVRLEIVTANNGTITIRDAPIWIIEDDMDEILLGDDILVRLGIDVFDQLNRRGGMEIDYLESMETEESFPFLGGDDEEKITKILVEKVENAVSEGKLPGEMKTKWLDLFMSHKDEFRTIMGHDPPARLAPLEVKWDPDKAERIRPARISYTEEQKEFMDYYTDILIAKGYAYENPNARYVSEALVIPKVERPEILEEDWRLVVNLKKANAATFPTYWPLPNIEDVQRYLHGARYFITLDLKNGYWQIRLHKDCQELFSFSTHRKVVTPTRIPHGCTDAVMFFTHLMLKSFEERIYKGIIPWLDDLLLYAQTMNDLFELLKWVLERANTLGLKFSPKKLTMLTQELKWCGKIITPTGVRVDPKRTESLVNMPEPVNAAQLMKFIYAANWIRTSLVDFAPTVAVLQDWLNVSLKAVGRRTARRAKGQQLEWDSEKREAYRNTKKMSARSAELAHPSEDATLTLFTDASKLHWSSFLGQVVDYRKDVKIEDQLIEPLYFLSGGFKGAQLKWSIVEKEGYAFFISVERLQHLLVRAKGFVVFTDHNNLRFIYGDTRSTQLNVRARLDRWALRLQRYRFDIVHISGETNVWADIKSRWGAAHTTEEGIVVKRSIRAVAKERVRHKAQPVVKLVSELEWPTLRSIRKYQAESDIPTSNRFTQREDGLWTYGDRIWIPDVGNVRHTLSIIAHYGLAGHYGTESTIRRLMDKFYWKDLQKDVKQLIGDCILCRCGKGTIPTRIHLGKHVRPTRPNQHLHFDYFYVGDEVDGFVYLLVSRDGFSRLVWLFETETTDAKSAVDAILKWIAVFGIPSLFFSDNASHFRNKTMEELARRLNVQHDFSTVYCAWANGLIERVLRDVKALVQILLHDLRIDRKHWTQLRANVMFAINQRPSRVLGGYAPVEIHMGLKASTPLDFIVAERNDLQEITWTPNMEKHLKNLLDSLDAAHESVTIATERINRQARLKETELPWFELGDFVLYCLVDRPHAAGKLYFQWVGPFQVHSIQSDYRYLLQDLASGKQIEAHVTRMSFYSTKQMHVTGQLKELITREGMMYEVDQLKNILWDTQKERYLVEVSWRGFSELEVSFEPFKELLEQIPLMVLEYLNAFVKDKPHDFDIFWEREKSVILKTIQTKKYEKARFHFIR